MLLRFRVAVGTAALGRLLRRRRLRSLHEAVLVHGVNVDVLVLHRAGAVQLVIQWCRQIVIPVLELRRERLEIMVRMVGIGNPIPRPSVPCAGWPPACTRVSPFSRIIP